MTHPVANKGYNVPRQVFTEICDLTDDIRTHEEELVRLGALPVTEKQLRVLFVEAADSHLCGPLGRMPAQPVLY